MKRKKEVLATLDRCYALAALPFQGKQHVLVASEPDDRCLLFDTEGHLVDTVWEHPGGVMSMVAVPGEEGAFYATHRFYSFDDAFDASVNLIRFAEGEWQVQHRVPVPFVHRIDILSAGDVRYLIICQLKSGQEYPGDWRFPGRILAARLRGDNTPGELFTVREGMFHNHGCSRCMVGGKEGLLIASDEGVHLLQVSGEEFCLERLLDEPASEAVLCDLDGDGQEELALITPFHGDGLKVYHRNGEGFVEVYCCEEKLPFLHGFYGGTLNGRNVILAGCRGGKRNLYLLQYDAADGGYLRSTLDEGRGNANLLVIKDEAGMDRVFATNRETDEIAVYDITW